MDLIIAKKKLDFLFFLPQRTQSSQRNHSFHSIK